MPDMLEGISNIEEMSITQKISTPLQLSMTASLHNFCTSYSFYLSVYLSVHIEWQPVQGIPYDSRIWIQGDGHLVLDK